MIEYKGRIAKWDNVKAILIVLVVIGHMVKADLEITGFSSNLYYFIYLFHMPAFIFISGMFSKSAIRNKNYDRVFSFLILYFLIKFLNYFSTLILTGKATVRIFTESGAAWYALAIFAYYLLTMFLKRYNRRYVLILAVVIGCVAGYGRDIGNRLALSRIFTFYPFFLMGYYMEADLLQAYTRKKAVKLLSAAVLVVFFLLSMKYAGALSWTVTLLKGNTPYRNLEWFREWGGAFRLIQYIVAALLTFCVIAIIPDRHNCFSYIGQRTRSIYALHWIFINIFYEGLNGIEWAQNFWPAHYQMLFIVIAVLITLLLSLKPFDILVNRLIIPGKEKKHE